MTKSGDVNIHEYFGGDSPLNKAFYHSIKDSSCLKYVEKLVEYGAYVNDIGRGVGGLRSDGYYNHARTPLMDACMSGQFGCVKFLVENGADINIRWFMGITALNYAIISRNFDIAIYLLEHGADFRVPIKYECSIEDAQYGGVEVLNYPVFLDKYVSELSDDEITKEQRERILYLISQEYKEPPLSHFTFTKKQRQFSEMRSAHYRKIREQHRSLIYEMHELLSIH